MWDLRTGSIFETIDLDYAITALQFDSRKIVAAAGENGVKVLYLLADPQLSTQPQCRYITVRAHSFQH